MKRKDAMRIMLWAPFGAGTHYWGPGTSAYRLYRLNDDPNVEVTLVHGTARQDSFPEVYAEQIKISDLEGASLLGKLVFLVKSLFWVFRNRKNYDVMHGLGPFWDTFFPALLFVKLGGKSYVKITGDNAGFRNNSLVSRLTGVSYLRKKNANNITGYISISNVITESLKNVGINENKIHEIPNGVDVHRFYPLKKVEKQALREELGLRNVFTFIFCGGLSHRKRVMETVQAAHKLISEKKHDVQLLVVGPDRSGEDIEGQLKKYISDNNLEKEIILVGSTNKPELYYQASDAYILASKSEGMSNSLLEAMACGLPSIVTKISGSEDLIDDGVHGVYTSGEPEDIAEKMKWLYMDSESLTKGINAKDKIIKEYAAEVVLDKHLNAFASGVSK